jgi:hypothetical protein
MKTVRAIAAALHFICKIAAIIVLLVASYATLALIMYGNDPKGSSMVQVLDDSTFRIFYPFSKTPFLLGDYNKGYIITSLVTVAFYGIFLWLLSGVFDAFKQPKLFTKRGVTQLSRFYITNLIVPFALLGLSIAFHQGYSDFLKIIFLHLIIGVFAFFMAAIFKQGLMLQEEQDLTF